MRKRNRRTCADVSRSKRTAVFRKWTCGLRSQQFDPKNEGEEPTLSSPEPWARTKSMFWKPAMSATELLA